MSTISPHTTFLCTHWNQYFLWSILVQDIAVMHGLDCRTINPVPLKKTEYHCNYTSELHRHLSEENLNAKYPSPHPTIEINTKCYILHYNTSKSAGVHCKRYISYIQCFRNQIYSHLHVTGFFTATAAILLIVSYGIYQNTISSASSKNSVCQALKPRSDPSHSYSDFIYDAAPFCNDWPASGFCWEVLFQNISSLSFSTFLLLFGCLLVSLFSNFFITFMIHDFLMCDHSEETDFLPSVLLKF